MRDYKEWGNGRSWSDQLAKIDRDQLRKVVGLILCIAFVAAIVGFYSYSLPAKADSGELQKAVQQLKTEVKKFVQLVDVMKGRAVPVDTEIPVYVHENGQTLIKLMPGKCVDPMSTMIIMSAAPDYIERFKAIESTWPVQNGGTSEFPGCWMELSAKEVDGDEAIFVLVFSDGHRGMIRKSEFLKSKDRGS